MTLTEADLKAMEGREKEIRAVLADEGMTAFAGKVVDWCQERPAKGAPP